jgi:hypothetical protein
MFLDLLLNFRIQFNKRTKNSGITGNKRSDEDINDQELYPPQDLINWLKKTDAKNREKR